MRRTLVAMYEDLSSARNVVNDLVSAGFARSDIGLATYDEAGTGLTYIDADDVKADEGAGFGALVGGLTGLVAGLAAITIPGIGPVIAAGPLAAALGGAAGAVIGAGAGAATGGLTAALVGMGVPEEEVGTYMEGLRRGSVLVTANIPEEQSSTAISVMNRHNPINIEDRTNIWRNEGWNGWEPTSSPYTAQDIQTERGKYTRRSTDKPSMSELQYVRTYRVEDED